MDLAPPGRLTTPHGDRELRERWSGGAEHGPVLTTPHGDREPPPRAAWSPSPEPLTTPHGDREPRSPTMGIGNSCGRDHARDELTLTTPHGDRELLAGRDHARDELTLTTPHGDREPTPRRKRQTPRPGPHYPPWGSGTGLPPVEGGDELLLTTPHGDRELEPWAQSGNGTHSLPPMGIGNLVVRRPRCRPALEHSLPPMGIGNWLRLSLKLARVEAHYPPWGSGTVWWARARVTVDLPLTTPHGDREPWARARAHASLSITHYPPWGSGTRCAPRPKKSGPSSHYPPWGSGTGGRDLLKDAALALTTPHGDREPEAAAGCRPDN